ncbi:DUF3168 domain-containing protein [Roseibium sp. RKSG952]|uniref:DUF3168 domain-containing protein n=1 Tax=Roseibium sp. RKSG952 TaxID=2529384 RepID=UPI0012BC9143|nr:DUF3168 domain-containing protein [Roseibium sp. RKSG952]MTH95853.1 DUF3168 domain-containing protein [Roseibium sp. RKSG952]
MSFQQAQTALRKGLFACLAADGTLTGLLGAGRLFDLAPRGQSLPYLVLRAVDTKPLLSLAEDGLEHALKLAVFSRAPNRDEAAEAAGRAADVLIHGPVPIAGYRLINLTIGAIASHVLKDGRGFQAETAIRAVTEPVTDQGNQPSSSSR